MISVNWRYLQRNLIFLLWACLLSHDSFSFIAVPTINPQEQQSLVRLKTMLPPNSIVLSPWDFDFFSKETPDVNQYHQTREAEYFPITYFVAKAYVAGDMTITARLLRFVATKANFKSSHSPLENIPELLKQWEAFSDIVKPQQSVYFIFTDSMIKIFDTISFIGLWDFARGTAPLRGFRHLDCVAVGGENPVINCKGSVINLRDGTVQNGIPLLSRAVIIEEGQEMRNVSYPDFPQGKILEVFIKNHRVERTLLMEEPYYQSSFNQLFILGQNNDELFRRLDLNLPGVQVFELR